MSNNLVSEVRDIRKAYVPKNKQRRIILNPHAASQSHISDTKLQDINITDRPSIKVERKFMNNKFDQLPDERKIKKFDHKTWKVKFDAKFLQLQNEFERLVKLIEARNSQCDCLKQSQTLINLLDRIETGFTGTTQQNNDLLLKITSIESLIQKQPNTSQLGVVVSGDDLSSFDNSLSRSIIKFKPKQPYYNKLESSVILNSKSQYNN